MRTDLSDSLKEKYISLTTFNFLKTLLLLVENNQVVEYSLAQLTHGFTVYTQICYPEVCVNT